MVNAKDVNINLIEAAITVFVAVGKKIVSEFEFSVAPTYTIYVELF